MKQLQILDATLRDGGYCNRWNFGFHTISHIIRCLVAARIDVIECGFLSAAAPFDRDSTLFANVGDLRRLLPETSDGPLFVLMVNYGDCDPTTLPDAACSGVDGLRVAFHKDDMKGAIALSHTLQSKGYRVFLQPMVSLQYSARAFDELIDRTNELRPHAFYIVDSFGTMKRSELFSLLAQTEERLDRAISLGFHAHNNTQMAFANAQSFVEAASNRPAIVDGSLFGMGRGAGNLQTELWVDAMNDAYNGAYRLEPLLHAVETQILPFFRNEPWGYSIPNLLAAIHGAHPNYASELANRHEISFQQMDVLFQSMPCEKRGRYDASYLDGVTAPGVGIWETYKGSPLPPAESAANDAFSSTREWQKEVSR